MGVFKFNRTSITIIIVMLGICIAGILIANAYYNIVNDSEDPRVLRAKELYRHYNDFAEAKKYLEIFEMLDSMELIYLQFDDYKYSYEMGVIYNNRAALQLNIALFEVVSEIEKDSLISMAKTELIRGIQIYENWNAEFGLFDEDEITQYLKPIYVDAFPLYNPSEIDNLVNKRKTEILAAIKEMPRRLSVSYTNLGIIYRHQGQVKEAVEYYQLALELWEENLTAKNNINILLGKPLEERSILDKLFPPNK